MASKNQSKEQVVASTKQLIAGSAKHLTGLTQVMLVGSTVTPADITNKLQTIVNLRADVDATRASIKAKLTVERTETPALRIFRSAFVSYVKAAYGTSPDVLADFGIAPKQRAPLTIEAKAAAAAKGGATRKARHTMGSQQKKAIKGDVTGVLVTPISAAAPVVTAPGNPAPPATGGGTPVATAPHGT
jgi:hypothetical protein